MPSLQQFTAAGAATGAPHDAPTLPNLALFVCLPQAVLRVEPVDANPCFPISGSLPACRRPLGAAGTAAAPRHLPHAVRACPPLLGYAVCHWQRQHMRNAEALLACRCRQQRLVGT